MRPRGLGTRFHLDGRASELTGITADALSTAPEDGWVALALLTWLYQRLRAAGGGRPVLLGHNFHGFDRFFLARKLGYHVGEGRAVA